MGGWVILRKEQLALLLLALVGLGVGTYYGATRWHEPTAVVAVSILLIVMGTVWFAVSAMQYRFYSYYDLIRLNAELAKLMYSKMRFGGVVVINGWLYYRSQGKRTRRSPWPRLWAVPLHPIPPVATGKKARIHPEVYWPGPFL